MPLAGLFGFCGGLTGSGVINAPHLGLGATVKAVPASIGAPVLVLGLVVLTGVFVLTLIALIKLPKGPAGCNVVCGGVGTTLPPPNVSPPLL